MSTITTYASTTAFAIPSTLPVYTEVRVLIRAGVPAQAARYSVPLVRQAPHTECWNLSFFLLPPGKKKKLPLTHPPIFASLGGRPSHRLTLRRRQGLLRRRGKCHVMLYEREWIRVVECHISLRSPQHDRPQHDRPRLYRNHHGHHHCFCEQQEHGGNQLHQSEDRPGRWVRSPTWPGRDCSIGSGFPPLQMEKSPTRRRYGESAAICTRSKTTAVAAMG